MSVIRAIQKLVGGRLRSDRAASAKDDGLVALHSWTGAALIAATVLASAVGTLDANVVKVAVPAIGRDLHAGVSALQVSVQPPRPRGLRRARGMDRRGCAR
jgi:hypothetical protein